ncbi:MAG: LacI family DNA-binding transcriptional regulator [Ruminococcus sp.]|nr:LacI family DNA-binding transcriptional regulator [Ruminococcus sp.]
MVSLKDISVRCGVSVATVSKALNGHKDVSEATREKLLKAAKEMGYFPNSQARALKTNRTLNLGVMFSDEAGSGLTHEFFAKVLNSFKTEAEAAGYDITFINKNVGRQKMSTYEHCKYRNVDGVIIACTDFTTQDVFEVINGDIPVVTIDHIFDCRTAIMSNNEKGIEELVDYVTGMGHKKIAYIQGNKSAVAERRQAGFCKACMNRGIDINPDWLLSGDYHNPERTYDLTKKLLSGSDRPSCIFMPDDYSAMGGLSAVKDMGLSVPGDVSVVGYDGIAYSQLLSPRLTTYLQDTTAIGTAAAKQLVSLIENPQTTFTEVITVDGQLIEGASVADLNQRH